MDAGHMYFLVCDQLPAREGVAAHEQLYNLSAGGRVDRSPTPCAWTD